MHGPIMQLGYVVGDVEQSAAAWHARTGAGPFLLMPSISFPGWTFNGAPQPLRLSIAFAQLDDMMIELIQPEGPWPNVYGDAPLAPGECRPHHHAYLVPDVDAAAAALDAGAPVTTARISDTAELRYYDCRPTLGLLVELITRSPETLAFFDLARNAARDWDGAGPVLRPLTDTAAMEGFA